MKIEKILEQINTHLESLYNKHSKRDLFKLYAWEITMLQDLYSYFSTLHEREEEDNKVLSFLECTENFSHREIFDHYEKEDFDIINLLHDIMLHTVIPNHKALK